MFSVFGESRLDPINITSTASEISAWKKSSKTINCFKELFCAINDDEENTYMSRILKKVFSCLKCSEEHSAFAISVCESFLNPDYESIQINETIIKDHLLKNKVNYYIFSKVFKSF